MTVTDKTGATWFDDIRARAGARAGARRLRVATLLVVSHTAIMLMGANIHAYAASEGLKVGVEMERQAWVIANKGCLAR